MAHNRLFYFKFNNPGLMLELKYRLEEVLDEDNEAVKNIDTRIIALESEIKATQVRLAQGRHEKQNLKKLGKLAEELDQLSRDRNAIVYNYNQRKSSVDKLFHYLNYVSTNPDNLEPQKFSDEVATLEKQFTLKDLQALSSGKVGELVFQFRSAAPTLFLEARETLSKEVSNLQKELVKEKGHKHADAEAVMRLGLTFKPYGDSVTITKSDASIFSDWKGKIGRFIQKFRAFMPDKVAKHAQVEKKIFPTKTA